MKKIIYSNGVLNESSGERRAGKSTEVLLPSLSNENVILSRCLLPSVFN